MIEALIGIGAIVLGLVSIELISRRFTINAGVMRKITHVATALLVIALSLLLGYKAFVIIGIVFAAIMAFLHVVYPLKSLSDRAHASLGEIWFPIGVAVSAALLHSPAEFVVVIFILGFADTAAYFAGSHSKSPRIIFNKTVAGSIAFLIIALLPLLFITAPQVALVVAIALTVTEAVSPFGSDNATVPIAASLALICF